MKWLPTYQYKGTPHTPVSDYFYSDMREIIVKCLPDKKKYEEFFNFFEYLKSLIYVDLMCDEISSGNIYFPIGRFAWKYYGFGSGRKCPKLINDFIENGLKQGQEWPLLKAGFFKGLVERFKECHEAYEYRLKEIGKSWF